MFLYADPGACPSCREPIAPPTRSCAACGVDLSGKTARQIFETLAYADRLVDQLRAVPATAAPQGAPTPLPPLAPPARQVLSAASVPKILLGLGALCLLVAAVVFLIVAWAVLGVGGRTLVLVGFTGLAGALTWLVARRGLRAGTETFASVALGLLSLDVTGAREAGWLGAIDDSALLLVAGAVVALAAGAMARWAAASPVAGLVSAEVIAVIAVGAAALGASATLGGSGARESIVALIVCAGAALTAHRLRLRLLAMGCAVESALCWLALTGVAIDRLVPMSVAHVWGDLAVWPTLVAAAIAGAVAVPTWVPAQVRVTAAAIASLLGTLALTVVSFDESATRVALVEMAVIAAYAVVAFRVPRRWTWAAAAPSVVAATALAGSVAMLIAVSLETLAPDEVWSMGLADRLPAPDLAWSWPLLLPAGAAAIGLTLATVLRCVGRSSRVVVIPAAAAVVLALALIPVLYAVPLGVAVLALAAAGAALGVVGLAAGHGAPGVAAVTAMGLALAAGLANDLSTAGVLAVVVIASCAAELRGNESVRPCAEGVTPAAAAALIWTLGHVAALPVEWQALPVLILLGSAVVLRPAPVREVVAGCAVAAAVAGSVMADGGPDQTWLAIYLTLAGVVATGSSLVNRDRRQLSWLGLALFTAAQWVRLQQLGVGTVEAYTLPLALVLLAAGVVALARGADSSVRTLAPGLGLALVPTLLQVLVEPVGTRAVLLGLGCLVLVAIGLARGLAAPMLAGAGTGALVVLREATFAQVLPQWAMIGLVGAALTVVGITWEQRLHELRRASAYVQALR